MKKLLIALGIFSMALLFEGCTTGGVSMSAGYNAPYYGYGYAPMVYGPRYYRPHYYAPRYYGHAYYNGPQGFRGYGNPHRRF